MLIFDAHLDLAMNALEWNRDIARPLDEVRRRETGKSDKVDRGAGVVTLGEMRRGRIGLCVATQIARYVEEGNPLPGWNSPEIAWAVTQGQLAWYRAMEEAGELVQIVDRAGLGAHVELWNDAAADDAAADDAASNDAAADDAASDDASDDASARLPIGYILSLEGADSLVTLAHLERAYAYGLRALGPAHYGAGRYAPGTGSEGPLTAVGVELVREMDRLGIILDATHLTDEAFWQALDLFHGPVWASHNNCRALVPHQRQFSDEQLKALIDRGAVIGMAFDAWMMHPGWIRGTTTPRETGLRIARIVDHIDHICQLAGSGRHCGIGSDLDGGYGREQCPLDLESIADLQTIPGLLAQRGYSDADVRGIMHGNWIRFLNEAWP